MVSANISRKKSATRRASTRAMSVGRTPNAYKKGLVGARMLGHRTNARVIQGMLRGLQAEALNARHAAATAQRRVIDAMSLAKTREEKKAAGAVRRAKAHAKAAEDYAAALTAAKGSTRRAPKQRV